MAQADYSISNQSFPATRADINSHLEAIATNNSGTSAPSTQYAGQFWIDTTSTTWTLYIHDGADDIQFATIDTSANTVNFIDSALASDVVINTSGDITTTGAFTSVGIDDNATSTAITIDSSENVSFAGDISTGNNGVLNILDGDGDISGKLANQSSSAHSLEIIADPSNSGANSNMIFKIDNSEKMRIDSSGNLLVGTTTQVGETATGGLFDPTLSIKGARDGLIELISSRSDSADAGVSRLQSVFSNNNASHKLVAEIQTETEGTTANQRGGRIKFNTKADGSTGVSERMRIDSSGNVLVGKTSSSVTVDGVVIRDVGQINITRGGDVCLMLNRQTTDGTLQEFRHANVTEGNISVSGATVSYNGFTGTHWSRFTDNSKPNILKGTVLESLDEMCDWYNLEFDVVTQDEDGNDITTPQKIPHVLTDGQSDGDIITYNHEGTDYQATIVKEVDVKHMMSKVSDTVDAKNVYGVFVAYDEDGEGYNDFYVASVGSFVVRIKANETIAKGDLLQSNGDGTAKVQTDDNVKSSSFAKVLSTTIIETYEDGSYLVPCSLMC